MCRMRKKIWVLFLVGMLFLTALTDGRKVAKAEEVNGKTEQSVTMDGELQVCPVEVLPDSEAPKDLPIYETKKGVSAKAISKNGYQGKYGYEQLALAEQKTVYQKLEEAADAFQYSDVDGITTTSQDGTKKNVAVTISLDKQMIKIENIGDTVVCFLYDHPEYFWSLGYSYYYTQDAETGDKWGTKITLACEENYVDGKLRATVREELQKEIESYLDLIAGVSTDYEKELILHDAIAERITYAYTSSGAPESERWAHSIVGVFSKEHYSAVCEGYAKAFQLLLNAAGIENIYIVGMGNGQGHAWNQVKIAGEWYYVDLTWNDTGDRKNYRYFNVDDSVFLKNHTTFSNVSDLPKVGEWCYCVPVCSATEYSYTQKGAYQEKESFTVSFGEMQGGTLQLFNQGVEVASGCSVASGTVLEVNIRPYVTSDTVEILTKWNEKYKVWKGIAGEDGISVTVPVTEDITFDLWVYVPVTEVKLNKESLSVTGYGVKKTLAATALPSTASDQTITWKSSNTKVATVQNGVVTSVGKGIAVIYAYAEKKSVLASCKVTVNAPYIKISSSKSSVKVGKTLAMKGTLYGATGKIKWSVSNTKRASIGSSSGIVKGKKAGSVWVIAKSGKITAKKKITIKK